MLLPDNAPLESTPRKRELNHQNFIVSTMRLFHLSHRMTGKMRQVVRALIKEGLNVSLASNQRNTLRREIPRTKEASVARWTAGHNPSRIATLEENQRPRGKLGGSLWGRRDLFVCVAKSGPSNRGPSPSPNTESRTVTAHSACCSLSSCAP